MRARVTERHRDAGGVGLDIAESYEQGCLAMHAAESAVAVCTSTYMLKLKAQASPYAYAAAKAEDRKAT